MSLYPFPWKPHYESRINAITILQEQPYFKNRIVLAKIGKEIERVERQFVEAAAAAAEAARVALEGAEEMEEGEEEFGEEL